jgi:hypothetical protein
MQNRRLCVLLCAVFGLALAHAQTATPAPEATGSVSGSVFGSVSGHVFCADTNEPARFATVILLPAPQKIETPPAKGIDPAQSVPPATRTGLDGSFLFPKVKPGTYFLIADYAGYVSPIAKLSPEEIKSKAPADIDKVEQVLIKITVASNKDSTRDLELERGAAIAGTVQYDDGSPANQIQISVLRLRDDGKASPVSLNVGGQMRRAFDSREDLQTNDLGHYRISGLPAGKYIIKTTLPTEIFSFGGLFGGPVVATFSIDDAGALSVYSGNVFREKDAKPIEANDGSERDDADITIPLLGLHTISGSVTALADGHAINWGSVSLLLADDKSELRTLNIPEDGRFNFRFVPEGEYILRVGDPADAIEEEGRDPQSGFVTSMDRKPVHSYASVDQPISVHSDLSSVNINVPDKPAPDKPTSTAQKQ